MKDAEDEAFDAIEKAQGWRKRQIAGQERNFCPRCGKRLGNSDWDVHTCTPPHELVQPKRTWVGLTGVEIASACKKNGGAEWWWRDIEKFARDIEAKLKEKNT